MLSVGPTWVLSVDFESWPRHIHFLGPTPELMVQVEVPHLAVELVITDVALDEVVGGPL